MRLTISNQININLLNFRDNKFALIPHGRWEQYSKIKNNVVLVGTPAYSSGQTQVSRMIV